MSFAHHGHVGILACYCLFMVNAHKRKVSMAAFAHEHGEIGLTNWVLLRNKERYPSLLIFFILL